MTRYLLTSGLLITLSLLLCSTLAASTASSSTRPGAVDESVNALHMQTINARDLKTLHYMENAHGQLEEWSSRLLARLERGAGPRDNDPVLDGRADLQVQKLAVTYASYTHTDALSTTLQHLANAHQLRLTALRTMIETGPDRAQYESLSTPVSNLVNELRDWSEKR